MIEKTGVAIVTHPAANHLIKKMPLLPPIIKHRSAIIASRIYFVEREHFN